MEDPALDNDLQTVLSQALECLDGLELQGGKHKADLEELKVRLSTGQFRLAVLGQFKRGKSTLLNALLGEDLLPADILPVTAIPTFIRYSAELSATVYFNSEEDDAAEFDVAGKDTLAAFLTRYVTEAGNPGNERGVKRVEIGHPADLLRQGVVLIDTPGIGSTHRHNTEVAYRILPECDAALFLVSPDPPITQVELEYLQAICRQLPRTFFLLNKIDFLDAQQRVASLKFLADQLSPLLGGVPQILSVSARQGLGARLAGDEQGWKESGLHQVEQSLVEFFAREKLQILHASLKRRISDQLDRICLELQLSLRALTLPKEELKQRISLFRQSLPDVEREKTAVVDVLHGDLQRLEGQLRREVETVRERAKTDILGQLENCFQTLAETEDLERRVRTELADKIPPLFAQELRRVSERVGNAAGELLILHQRRSNDLIERVRQNAAELFDIPYRAPSAQDIYTTFAAPGWSSDLFISDMDPLGQRLSRKFVPRKFRHRRTIVRLREEAKKLLNQNSEQISWSLKRGLQESFRRFGAKLDEQLANTIAAIGAALDIALQRSESQAYKTAAQELQLQKTLDRLKEIQRNLEAEASA